MTSPNRSLESAINRLVDNLTSQSEANRSRELFTAERSRGPDRQAAEPAAPNMDDDRRLFENNDDDHHDTPDPEPIPSGRQLKEEFQELHLLTQYLEPSSSRTDNSSSQRINMTPTSIKGYELSRVKQNYLEKQTR